MILTFTPTLRHVLTRQDTHIVCLDIALSKLFTLNVCYCTTCQGVSLSVIAFIYKHSLSIYCDTVCKASLISVNSRLTLIQLVWPTVILNLIRVNEA